MQATEGQRAPFSSADWIYEIKFDGYRCMAGIDAGEVKLMTKSGSDCTNWYPEVLPALAALPGGPHVLDAEAVVMREDGTSDFNRLQERARRRKWYPGAPPITLAVFDILVHEGRKVMDFPLMTRKELLQHLMAGMRPGPLLFVKELPADAALFHAMVLPKEQGGLGLQIEGVMAKRRDSPYLPGVRSDSWVKIKRPGWQEGRRWTG